MYINIHAYINSIHIHRHKYIDVRTHTYTRLYATKSYRNRYFSKETLRTNTTGHPVYPSVCLYIITYTRTHTHKHTHTHAMLSLLLLD